jgi:spermidine synthase
LTPIALRRSPRWLLPLLFTLFFGSGACALVYQVMWLRLLSLVFGVTVYAASTVLAGFMAGLGVGSLIGGRLASRFTRPLAAFGFAETLVGVTAFATPFLLRELTALWIAVNPSLPQSLAALTMIRFVVAFLVLIVPTSLMGATLPLVIKSAVGREDRVGGRVGALYAINTTGAIAGALVAGFYFISELGVARSFQIAAATNLLIGAIAIAAGYLMPAQSHRPASTADDSASAAPSLPLSQRRAVLWTFFVSGVLSLALEIIWFRMLVVFLRPTAYAFTIMLACVLGGIAIGSALAAPLLRARWPWLRVLAVIQGLIGVAAVLSFNLLSQAQAAIDAAVPWFERVGLNPYLAPLVVSSLIAMLPTTILLGVAFPIGLMLWAGDSADEDTSRRTGAFYSLNVVGAILGSVLAGFVLLPQFGTRTSLIIVSSLATMSSIGLAIANRKRDSMAMAIAVAAPVLLVIGARVAVDPFDVAFARFHRGETLVWREEGAQTTVAVHDRGGRQPMRIMFLDGNHQANDSPGTAFIHHRIGALPAMLHPNPRTALVVGLGGGATPGAVARLNLDVDVVELSHAVVAGSAFFKNINFDLLSRPNVHLRVDDGRNFMLMTRKKYDVITADIILPRHAGAGSLYSREYYELVRSRLNEGGVAMQWNGGDSATEYKLLMRTFQSVFPYTTLWGDGSLMLGSLKPFTLSQSAYESRRTSFEQFPWDIATLKRIFIAGPDEIRAFVGEGPLLTDDKPMIEYFLSLPKNDAPGGYTGQRAPIETILTR